MILVCENGACNSEYQDTDPRAGTVRGTLAPYGLPDVRVKLCPMCFEAVRQPPDGFALEIRQASWT